MSGAVTSSLSRPRAEDDYYTTPSWCVRRFLEAYSPPPSEEPWFEPSAGNGAIIQAVNAIRKGTKWNAAELREEERGILVKLCREVWIRDFLKLETHALAKTRVALGNPPYMLAFEFIQQIRKLCPLADIALLLRLNFAASATRAAFMRANPPDVYVLPNRPSYTGEGTDSPEYAWMVWPPAVSRSAGLFRVLKETPLEERKLDVGHRVMIAPAQVSLF